MRAQPLSSFYPMKKILIVDDERAQREALGGFLKKKGFETLKAGSGEEALKQLEESGVNLLLVDLKLPEMSGLDLLSEVKKRYPNIEVIVITAFGSIETAVRAMKLGAFHYLTKPIDLEELLILINRALEKQEMELEIQALREELRDLKKSQEIIAESPKMKEVLSLIYRVALTPATVLLIGESGTGKELLARAIHEASTRRGRFVAVSCAAIPENLLESELFGYEKGAFTGADRPKPGKFELADGGTLFLDEIGDLPQVLQPKLLRAIQEKEVERLGGTRPIKVDVRIISATNQDLEKKVREGKFREDLFYRLNVVRIDIPPLRERPEDIIPLANHFLKKYREELKKPVEGFTEKAERLLLSYKWPGNVRELENAVERAVVLTRKNYIEPEDLPIGHREEFLKEPMRLDEVEANHIRKVIGLTKGNLGEAARILGIHRNTLREKLKKYGIKKSMQ